MTPVFHEEQPNGSKRCKYITSTLKDAFASCHTFRARLSSSASHRQDEEDDDDEQEVLIIEFFIMIFFFMTRRVKKALYVLLRQY